MGGVAAFLDRQSEIPGVEGLRNTLKVIVFFICFLVNCSDENFAFSKFPLKKKPVPATKFLNCMETLANYKFMAGSLHSSPPP